MSQRRGRDGVGQVAATPGSAARIAGVSSRQVDYWRRNGLVTPALSKRLTVRNEVRLYNVKELVELRVIGELRKAGLSLQHIRKVLPYLRRHSDAPLSELKFAVSKKELYFQTADGTWSGGRSPDQVVIHQVIPLRELRESVERAATASPERRAGQITRMRNVHGSKPVFDGTRVPVETVQRWVEAGASDERILEAYPSLGHEDLARVRTLAAAG